MDFFRKGRQFLMELLSPAGSFEALKAAVQNGADAVYLGASEFSARRKAVNFSEDELEDAVKYCHIRGTKVYLALNTLLYDAELLKAESLLRSANDIGVDAVIVQDMGLVRIAKEVTPFLPLHASTQMTVLNAESAKELTEFGLSRIVLPREMTAEQAESISEIAETEIFVHGALCMCYSGRCLFSSMIGGRSGNRGECAQPCRKCYEFNGKRGFFLSPYDLSLINQLGDMEKRGIASLKIEGRMKSAEYVAIVTRSFRNAMDNGMASGEDIKNLKEIFCRGERFTKGYYGGDNTRLIINTSESNDRVLEKASNELKKKALASFSEGAENKKNSVVLELDCGDEITLNAEALGETVTVKAAKEDTAPLFENRVKEQLSKLGGTPFRAKEISVTGQCFLKISSLNALRREVTEKLTETLGKPEKREMGSFDYCVPYRVKQKKCSFTAAVLNYAQAEKLLECDIERIYLPLSEVKEKLDSRIFVALPSIIKEGEQEEVLLKAEEAQKNGAAGLLCDSLEGIITAKKLSAPFVIGAGLNICNKQALAHYASSGALAVVLSPELSAGRAKSLSESGATYTEAIIYGRITMMITENCIIKNSGGKCVCKGELKDSTGAVFPVIKADGSCRNKIYNSRPVFLADRDYSFLSYGMLSFTTESPEEAVSIYKKYKNAETYDMDYTRGFFK